MTNTGVHLTQLITESVKASIHVHKLYHDGLESHFTCKRRRSRGGQSRRSRKNCHLSSWPLRSKLGLTLSNGRCVYGTHNKEVWRFRIGDGRMSKNPRDSRRENELIMGCCILIDIYKGGYEVRRKVYGKSFKKGQQKSSTRLSNRIIVRQGM